MRVLWVTNTILPDLAEALGMMRPVTTGWMFDLAKNISKTHISLVVATSRPNVAPYQGSINNITYLLIKGRASITEYDETLVAQWKKIIQEVNPDLVHIHGTEYAHGLALMKACPQLRYVISIQGMTSVISRYYLGGMTLKDILQNITFRDIVRWDNLLLAKMKFKNRGNRIERAYLSLGTDFIGRTEWDHDHIMSLNEKCRYHFCNESLRDAFYYAEKWNIKTKKNHTIFLSQAHYPLKGLHQVIKAVNIIKDLFPKIKIRVAGGDIIKSKTFKERIRISGYGKYILSLIKKFKLEDHIEFTGLLDENGMINEYLNCNVFICPSSIENSPNSLGEAQILGVPCIASYVGGVPDMIQHQTTGLLYRYEEVEMLAQQIKAIFTDDLLAEKLSLEGIIAASKRHDRHTNLETTLKIYEAILDA